MRIRFRFQLQTSSTHREGKERDLRLTISDHGNKVSCNFGKDVITVKNFADFAMDLILLYPAFAKDGWVKLTHCQLAQNETLLQLFAATFGVPVYASTESVDTFNRSDGTWTRCTPSGMIYRNSFFPGDSDYRFGK
jgi:hypothetical protein